MVASYNRDPWYLFILGQAKNSEVEMGAYRFFEFMNELIEIKFRERIDDGSSFSFLVDNNLDF